MTEQYLQRNINKPEGSDSFAGDTTLDISAVGKLVLVDTSAAAATVTLPSAAESGAGAQVTIVATTGATNGLNFAAAPGDSLVGTPPPGGISNPLTKNDASATCRSDGDSTWYVVGGLD